MGFNVEFRDKDDSIIDWAQLDKEVCDLWRIAPDPKHWATPPGKDVNHNWHEFLGRAVMLMRAYKETGTFIPSDLLSGLCNYGDLYPTLDRIELYKYEIQLILHWTRKEYKIIVTNRW